jgi:hypothetical protein
MNDLLGNLLRVLQIAGVMPTANRFDDLVDALNKLYGGPSADAGNVLQAGADGKPLLTDAAVKQHETVTSQTWDAVNKILTLTNEAGATLIANLGAVDAHLDSATLQAGMLILHGANGEPDVTVDLTAYLQAVTTQNGDGIALTGAGTATSPLQARVVIDPSPTNMLRAGPNGLQVEPSQLSALPTMNVLLEGFGSGGGTAEDVGLIDQGSWYQINFNTAICSLLNGFTMTPNSDGTATIPDGVYLVSGSTTVVNYAYVNDTYQLPDQIIFAVGQNYPWPGIYQYAVQRLPSAPIATQSVSEAVGGMTISGVQQWSGGSGLWMGFSKILGAVNANPLSLQGYVSLVKIG